MLTEKKEDLQLVEPTVDKGWDFMVAKNGKKLQVKRFRYFTLS